MFNLVLLLFWGMPCLLPVYPGSEPTSIPARTSSKYFNSVESGNPPVVSPTRAAFFSASAECYHRFVRTCNEKLWYSTWFLFAPNYFYRQLNLLSKIQEVTPHISVIYCCGSAWWSLYTLNCCPATKRLFTEIALHFVKHYYFLLKRQQGTWSWDGVVVPVSKLRIGHLRNRSISGRCKRPFCTTKRPDRRCGATRLLSMGTGQWLGRGLFRGIKRSLCEADYLF
jgi:hypothetical protein